MTYIDLFRPAYLEDYYRTDAHWRQAPARRGPVSGRRHGDAAADYTEVTLDRPFYGGVFRYAALPLAGGTRAISPTIPSPPAGSSIMRPAGKARCTTWKRPGGLTRMSCFCPVVSLLTVGESQRPDEPGAGDLPGFLRLQPGPAAVEVHSRVTLVDIRYLSLA